MCSWPGSGALATHILRPARVLCALFSSLLDALRGEAGCHSLAGRPAAWRACWLAFRPAGWFAAWLAGTLAYRLLPGLLQG